VDVYYQERFGRVRAERTRRLRNAAGRVVAYWWATGRARRHWLFLALAPFAAAFVPAAGVATAGRSSIGLLLVVVGTVEVLGGLRDHTMLLAKIREVHLGLRG